MIKKKFEELKENEKIILEDISREVTSWLSQQPGWKDFIKDRCKWHYDNYKYERVGIYMSSYMYIDLELNEDREVTIGTCTIKDYFGYSSEGIIKKIENTEKDILHKRELFKEYLEAWLIVFRDDYEEIISSHCREKLMIPEKVRVNKIDYKYDGRFKVGFYAEKNYITTEYISLEEL